MSHLGGYGLSTKVGTLWIQVLHRLPKCAHLQKSIEKEILCYSVYNGLLCVMVGYHINTIGGYCKVALHEHHVRCQRGVPSLLDA